MSRQLRREGREARQGNAHAPRRRGGTQEKGGWCGGGERCGKRSHSALWRMTPATLAQSPSLPLFVVLTSVGSRHACADAVVCSACSADNCVHAQFGTSLLSRLTLRCSFPRRSTRWMRCHISAPPPLSSGHAHAHAHARQARELIRAQGRFEFAPATHVGEARWFNSGVEEGTAQLP